MADNRKQARVGRINLQPAEPVLDASHIEQLIVCWLDDCALRLPAETIDGYRYKIQYFCDWWAERGPGLAYHLRRRDLIRFEMELRSMPARHGDVLSYHTRNDVLRRLRQMFKWSFREGYTSQDYSSWLPAADGEPPRRTAATLAQLRSLFLAAAKTSYPARNRAILALFIGTGVRRGECASLTVADLRFHADGSGVATVRGKRTKANRTGVRDVAFDAATGSCLLAYLEASGYSDGPLWPGRDGRPLSVKSLYRIVRQCVASAGLDGMIQACHDLRRAFATHYARAFKGQIYDDILRRQMGHTTFRMTAQYSLLDADDIRESIRSPMSLWEFLEDEDEA